MSFNRIAGDDDWLLTLSLGSDCPSLVGATAAIAFLSPTTRRGYWTGVTPDDVTKRVSRLMADEVDEPGVWQVQAVVRLSGGGLRKSPAMTVHVGPSLMPVPFDEGG